MDAGLAAVFAAVIAALGGIIVAIIQMKNFAEENRNDHAVVQKRLDNLIDMVAKQGAKLTNHQPRHRTSSRPNSRIPTLNNRRRQT